LRQQGIELVENGIAKAGRHALGIQAHVAAQAVAALLGLENGRLHGPRGCGMRAARRMRVDELARDRLRFDVRARVDRVHALDPGADFELRKSRLEELLGDSARATRPIVSRADARPPPCHARIPYFASYVKSAWLGR